MSSPPSPTGPDIGLSHHLRPRGLRALLAVLAVVGVLLVGLAPPASAHATVVATDPAAGSVLTTAPEAVTFTFSEPVSTVPDGVDVYDAAGEVIASSASTSGADLVVDLAGTVGEGTLVVSYRVVSRDGHPISGSLIFSVGAPSSTIKEPPRAEAGDPSVPWTLSLLRVVGYVGLFLAAGLVLFAALVLPADRATDGARRRVVLAARGGAVLGVLGWVVALPVTASYQVGSVRLSALAPSEYGVTAAVVVGLVVAVALVARSGRALRVAAGAAAVATLAPAFTGHTRAATPEWLAVAADVLHLLAGSTWLGGLVGLALVLGDLSGRGTLAGQAVARFSTIAAGVLGALVVTGTLLSWRVLGSWSGLVTTTYGRLLLVKIVAALVVVGVAAYNRSRLVPSLEAATQRKDRRAAGALVRRAVTVESAVLVGVLAVTGLLVDRNPDGDPVGVASVGNRATTQTATLGAIDAEVTLSRLTPGPTGVTVELRDRAGEPTEGFATPQATLASDAVDLGPVALRNVAIGVYVADVVIPAQGTWRLDLALQVDATQTPEATLQYAVG